MEGMNNMEELQEKTLNDVLIAPVLNRQLEVGWYRAYKEGVSIVDVYEVKQSGYCVSIPYTSKDEYLKIIENNRKMILDSTEELNREIDGFTRKINLYKKYIETNNELLKEIETYKLKQDINTTESLEEINYEIH